MTQDKIIAAALEVGFEVHPGKQQARVGWDTLTGDDSTPKLARFYAIAYRQGLEDAVSACDETMAPFNIGSIRLANAFHDGTHACIDAIRALKEQPNG